VGASAGAPAGAAERGGGGGAAALRHGVGNCLNLIYYSALLACCYQTVLTVSRGKNFQDREQERVRLLLPLASDPEIYLFYWRVIVNLVS
jgi:hypothetical protein